MHGEEVKERPTSDTERQMDDAAGQQGEEVTKRRGGESWLAIRRLTTNLLRFCPHYAKDRSMPGKASTTPKFE